MGMNTAKVDGHIHCNGSSPSSLVAYKNKFSSSYDEPCCPLSEVRMHSTRCTQRGVGPDWWRLLCHDHQGSLFDPPLCPGPVNVQTPGLLKRRNIFCSLRIDTSPRFPGCPTRKFKVNVERIDVRNKQRKSARFNIKGRGRNGSVGLMNIRGRVIGSFKVATYWLIIVVLIFLLIR
jgi:hypothetical protein